MVEGASQPGGAGKPAGVRAVAAGMRRGRALPATILALAAALGLCGCVSRGGADDAERYPGWMVSLYEPAAPVLGEAFGRVVMRRGLLADKAAAQRHVARTLRPLDILVVSSKGRLSGALVPGLFTHMVIYVGSERELKALGVWNHPAVKPHQAAIRAGATLIESDHRGVHLTTAETALDTDRVAVLRPRLDGGDRRGRAVKQLLDHLGTPYDFVFDNSDSSEIYCAELIDRVMPEIRLPARTLYGQSMFLPDDTVTAALDGTLRTSPILYVRSTDAGWEVAGRAALAGDVAEAWRE